MKRLALIHTVIFAADLFRKKLADRFPDLRSFHVVDESLLQDLMKSGGAMPPGLVRRLATQAGLACDAGADVILFTCSSTSPAVDMVRPMIDIPIVKIDDPLADAAVRIGGKIGLVCTARTTLGPSERLIREHAGRQGRKVEIVTRLEAAAFEAVMAGNKARHDALVKQAAMEMALDCDVIVLAQASMAHLVPELAAFTTVPVLAAPDLCVEALSDLLAD